MKKLCAALLCLCLVSGFAPAAEKISALLISGDDVAPFHDWKDIGESTREVLDQSGKFDVRVCEDPFILDSSAALQRYDVIILTMFNAHFPTISDQAKENLIQFINEGKGFVVCHLATASFKEWDEFKTICGRVWVMGTSGHNPRSQFDAKVVNKEHPITKGIEDFKIFDELYAKLQGDSEITVLVEADSDFSNKTEPLCFVKEYGKGRVFNTAFGHDYKAIKHETYKKILTRGCEWAATGNVTE